MHFPFVLKWVMYVCTQYNWTFFEHIGSESNETLNYSWIGRFVIILSFQTIDEKSHSPWTCDIIIIIYIVNSTLKYTQLHICNWEYQIYYMVKESNAKWLNILWIVLEQCHQYRFISDCYSTCSLPQSSWLSMPWAE